MPAGLVLISPEVDLTESGDSFHTDLGVDHVLGSLMQVNLLYATGHASLHVFEAMPHGGFCGAPEDLELAAEVQRFVERRLGWPLLCVGDGACTDACAGTYVWCPCDVPRPPCPDN
jgi:hypothetical protein